MTNKEVVIHLIGSNADYSDADLNISMQLAGIDPNAVFFDRCKIYGFALLKIQSQKSVKKVTEGGYSVEYSDSSIPAVLYSIAKESGCADLIAEFDIRPAKPTIIGRSDVW